MFGSTKLVETIHNVLGKIESAGRRQKKKNLFFYKYFMCVCVNRYIHCIGKSRITSKVVGMNFL